MTIVKDSYPFILAGVIASIFAFFIWGLTWAVIPILLTLYFIYFFRNPNRPLPNDSDVIYSAADGRVMAIEDIYDDEYLNEPAIKITVFLSVFNVHVNRSPMAGEIKYQRYNVGKFVPAFQKSATFKNERHAIGLDNGKIKIMVVQVAGLLARRIVSWVTLGSVVKQGECYGMIKFGSSTEVIVPKNVEILVKKGQNVKGGITPIGRIKE
ncbi:MAG: phosphatidylserine decarboxylase family protein [Phascolarctobacterium sp.]|nr:phosphatidylserine decarboxylase family protein [Candidatus Phascolarctobacterium caballi]